MPGLLGTRKRFEASIKEEKVELKEAGATPSPADRLLRRLKDKVSRELPPKMET